jgi:hypothetical protein
MKPILFNTEMVKAILDDRKTVTRRVIKPKYSNTHFEIVDTKYGKEFREIQNQDETTHGKNKGGTSWQKLLWCREVPAPYKPGDILYVTETWKVDSINQSLNNMLIDFKALQSGFSQAEISADFDKDRFIKFKKFYQKNGWQSPYFMPKEAARIFLRVKDVRVERTKEMSIQDMINEGINTDGIITTTGPISYRVINRFEELWNSTVKEEQYKFASNPWVWVIEFERISKEEASNLSTAM